MALLNEDALRGKVSFRKSIQESQQDLRRGAVKSFGVYDRYDIFLCHAYLDAKVIEGLKNLLQEKGFSVYVDWMENPELDHDRVTPANAAIVRDAMCRSSSLLYAASEACRKSLWTPWELGYSDALHSRVAVLPVAPGSTQGNTYRGIEYLGLYPYIDITGVTLWVNRSSQAAAKSGAGHVDLREWVAGKKTL